MAFCAPPSQERIERSESLLKQIAEVQKWWDALSPKQQEILNEIQKLSYVTGELLMGNDNFEAQYSYAILNDLPLPTHNPELLKIVEKNKAKIEELKKEFALLNKKA